MYAANVKGQDLNFSVSGMLWKRSLVMRDEETGSLWSHILGQAMKGKLKGENLEIIPSLLTDWGTWKRQHPETTAVIMSRTSRDFNQKFYRNPENFVVGLSNGESARAWRFDHMVDRTVLNDQWRGEPVVVHLQISSYSATVFSRKLGTQILYFEKKDDVISDRQTGSTWNLQLGKATSGPLSGTKLQQLQSTPSFSRAWKKFHPKSTYYQPQDEIKN